MASRGLKMALAAMGGAKDAKPELGAEEAAEPAAVDEPAEEAGDPGEEAAAEEFIAATDAGDAKGVVSALKNLLTICYPDLGK